MSDENNKLKVVLCWHMHQPDYRGPDHSDYQLPWVYLHGIKDYVDMAYHLEANPKARAVVNFAPVLLEQLADYAEQIQAWLQFGKRIRDPVLGALAGPGIPTDRKTRRELVKACQRANETHLIKRFSAFDRLIELASWLETHPGSIRYLNDQYMVDLLVWYHLAWMGDSVRKNDLRIKSLQKKRRSYDLDDRRRLVGLIGELISGVIGRYRRLAELGRVELSVSPYAHPIIPLLLDINSTKEAMPDAPLPELAAYPDGEPRARWHIRKGLEVFEQFFGFRPEGCWPSEGAVSTDTLRLLEEEGFRWAASGQQVLHNSLTAAGDSAALDTNWLHLPYRFNEGRLNCFFRDDGLSDLIGFKYADWHADDAVANLVHHLENIADACADEPDSVASIIMDGENAWEYYPHNGSYFLTTLYEQLANHPRLELTTFSDCIRKLKNHRPTLPHIVAGSWVYGTFSTWIGDPDKNRAWDMLGEAKEAFDQAVASGQLHGQALAEAELQLATCEGSDWFWWFGDYNPGQTVSDFERLFRRQLRHLYEMLGEQPPAHLFEVFASGSGAPARGGVMKRNV
ncbi:Amylopullulanase [hydrothermal vent metagenome]|uniref:Amylopullulanase n=1 Tax=hydrothermal vent metagenome TaxID=652676 RepID=A0A3B1BK85_9ZZZZ